MYTKMFKNNKLHKMLRANNKDRIAQIPWCFLLTGLILIFTSIPVQAAHLSDIRVDISILQGETLAQIPEDFSDSLVDALNDAISNIEKANDHTLEGYECKSYNFIEGASSKMNKYVNKLESLLTQQKVSSAMVDPLILQASDIVESLNNELPGGGAPASAMIGAELYAKNLCMLCHGDDGSGGIIGVNIVGKANCDIYTTIMTEEVHRGITTTVDETKDLAAFLADPGPLPGIATADFANPKNCRICHPRQYEEWQGNMMSYGARSPVFSALEAFGNKLTGGALAKIDGVTDGSDLFCQRCHNPVDSALGNFPTFADSNGLPLREFASDVGKLGLSCDVCHQVSAPDLTRSLIGDLGDGIGNDALIIIPGTEKFGPFTSAQPNPVHESTNSEYLKSSEFCGACHDVRPRAADVIEGDNFQRLEDLFTEWQKGPYGPTIANTVGGVVTCQDCHMDAGPPDPAGTYPKDKTSVYPRPRYSTEREVSTHYFTGVDIALIEDFPGQDDPGLDSHGYPIGQKQRRDDLLKSAAAIGFSAPTTVGAGEVLPITVDVTNIGTGHNLPSGFSQERQMWVELIVTDGDGIIYQSGYLQDSAHPETGESIPDGNLHDEDLQNIIVVLDPETGEATTLEHGPDYNLRHDHPPVNLGIAYFGNEFIRVTGVEEEEVFIPFLANHMDNSHSIPALETESVQYDVPIPAGTTGPISITARLLFRPFPPRFLRFLAQVQPNLVDEALVDRNVIIEMAEATPVDVLIQVPVSCGGSAM
jgi:hypothetical protein